MMGAGFKYYRLLYTLFSFVGLAAVIIFQYTITSRPLFKQIFFIQIAGAVISIVGVLIMSNCILKYFMQLSGIRWLTNNQPDTKLMLDTLHKRVRHPLYPGNFYSSGDCC